MSQTTNTHSAGSGGGGVDCGSTGCGHHNVNCGNVDNSHHITYNSDKDAEIMRWLSPLEPENRHHGVRTDRHEGAGDWLLGTKEFREWRRGEDGANRGVLFCSGDPGVGKTYLR